MLESDAGLAMQLCGEQSSLPKDCSPIEHASPTMHFDSPRVLSPRCLVSPGGACAFNFMDVKHAGAPLDNSDASTVCTSRSTVSTSRVQPLWSCLTPRTPNSTSDSKSFTSYGLSTPRSSADTSRSQYDAKSPWGAVFDTPLTPQLEAEGSPFDTPHSPDSPSGPQSPPLSPEDSVRSMESMGCDDFGVLAHLPNHSEKAGPGAVIESTEEMLVPIPMSLGARNWRKAELESPLGLRGMMILQDCHGVDSATKPA